MPSFPCIGDPPIDTCVELVAVGNELNVQLNLEQVAAPPVTTLSAAVGGCASAVNGVRCGPNGLWAPPPYKAFCQTAGSGGLFTPIPTSGTGTVGPIVTATMTNTTCVDLVYVAWYGMGPVRILQIPDQHMTVGFDLYEDGGPVGSTFVEHFSGSDFVAITFPSQNFLRCGSIPAGGTKSFGVQINYNHVLSTSQATVFLGSHVGIMAVTSWPGL